jgi:hypothetical protein
LRKAQKFGSFMKNTALSKAKSADSVCQENDTKRLPNDCIVAGRFAVG